MVKTNINRLETMVMVLFCFWAVDKQLKEVIFIRTPVSWVGNKTSILHILYALFPLQYGRYIEPFGGSGSVLLGKTEIDKFEVYNDYNQNLVNLFRCMRERPLAFIKELGFLPLNSRDDFMVIKKFFEKEEFSDEFLKEELELTTITLPPIEAAEVLELYKASAQEYNLRRATLFLKLLRYSYSSSGRSFSCQPFSIRSLFGLVQDLSQRMDKVVIENQDFEALIKHYDRADAFFYCDPPYFTSEYVYTCGFTLEDHIRLRDSLASASGKWLVSYNDCEEIRKLYIGYEIFDFKRLHNMVQKYEAGKEFPELLIGNYDLYERVKANPRQLTLFDYLEGYPKDNNTTLKESIISSRVKSKRN